MGRYLLEHFLPASHDGTPAQPDGAAFPAHAGVRLLQTIYVPDDEVCFYLLESDTLEQVEHASRNGGLSFERIHVVQSTYADAQQAATLSDEQAIALAHQARKEMR